MERSALYDHEEQSFVDILDHGPVIEGLLQCFQKLTPKPARQRPA